MVNEIFFYLVCSLCFFTASVKAKFSETIEIDQEACGQSSKFS